MAGETFNTSISRTMLPAPAAPPISSLMKQLGNDMGELVHQELALAKAELHESARVLVKDATKIGIALGLVLPGVLALTAFLVIGLGSVMGDRYWLSALILGAVYLVAGRQLLMSALHDIKRRGLPAATTIQTLREDAVWATREAQVVKHELTS